MAHAGRTSVQASSLYNGLVTISNTATPTEIKAQAIALHAMGYSCRAIEKQLSSMFMGATIPNYATISRWVRVRNSYRRYLAGAASVRWARAHNRAAEIVEERLEELGTMPFDKIIVALQRISEVYDMLRESSAQGHCEHSDTLGGQPVRWIPIRLPDG